MQFLTSVVLQNFRKLESRRLVNLPVIDMKSDSNRNAGRFDLSGKLGFVPAPRETDPTSAVTRPAVQDRGLRHGDEVTSAGSS